MQPLIAPIIESSTASDTNVPPIEPMVRIATSAPTRSAAAISGMVITFR